MNLPEIIFLVLSVIGGLLTIMVVYGTVVKKRDLILSALFYYSFLPIIGETMGLVSTKSPHHFLFIGLFVVQLVLASIKNAPFNETDETLKQYSKRIAGSLIAINLFSAIFILVISSAYPIYLGVFHAVITVSLGYAIIQRLRGKMTR